MLYECWDSAMVVRMDEKYNGLRGDVLRSIDLVIGVVRFLLL
jgi:hypothetical protein